MHLVSSAGADWCCAHKVWGHSLSQPGVGLERGSWEVCCAVLPGQRPNTKLVLVPAVDRAIGTHLLAKNGTPVLEGQTACHQLHIWYSPDDLA